MTAKRSNSRHNHMDRDTAHAVMTTSMLLIGATIILSQGWWQALRNWIGDKTVSGASKPLPAGTQSVSWKWVVGFILLWLMLSLMIESASFSELGAALSALIAMSVMFAYGPAALKNLGVVNAQGK
jgi:hypothetical protein